MVRQAGGKSAGRRPPAALVSDRAPGAFHQRDRPIRSRKACGSGSAEAVPTTAWNGCACCGRPGFGAALAAEKSAVQAPAPAGSAGGRVVTRIAGRSIRMPGDAAGLRLRCRRQRRRAARTHSAICGTLRAAPGLGSGSRWPGSSAMPRARIVTANSFAAWFTAANKTPIGCYLYYGRPRGIAWVLQILAQPKHTDAVVNNLLAHAGAHGCVAVRGRTQPSLSTRCCAIAASSSSALRPRSIPATPS